MKRDEAIALLKKEAYTLLLYNDRDCHFSQTRGVAPLLSFLEKGQDVSSYCAIDKVVGKAAAFLYLALGIKKLHAITVSESALSLLSAHSVSVTYEALVPRILNREGNGYCPMESAVLCETSISSAIERIKETRAALLGK